MNLIVSIISLILLTIVPIKTQVRSVEEELFYNNCYNAYNSYALELENDNASYSLLVLIGEYDSKISYSIFFELVDSNKHELYIRTSEEMGFYPTVNSKGGCSVYNLISDGNVSIEIHQENVETFIYELKLIDLNNYNDVYKDKQILGNNKGFSDIEDLNNKTKATSPLTFILSIVFIFLIMGSIIIILVMYAFRKGLFNEDTLNKEFEQEHEFRDGIRDYISKFDEENMEIEAEEDVNNNDQINKEEPVKEVYKKNQNYDFEDIRDVSLILQEKGFKTNYQELSNNEKNEIMIELMKMRHMKEITDEEYRSEIIKLWM